MGRLWVAEHQTLEIEVAVKLLNPELARDALWLARFREEALAIAKIDSVHVVRVFDCGTTSRNEPFIVMELLRGEDLLRHIERANGFSLEEILQIVSQICKALSRAHALGIVHRDLKPENIFLTKEGEETFVKLLDFGIAKHQWSQRTSATEANSIFGTPPYMSPEQIVSAGSVDHRADLWALCVLIFEMLTGTSPFAAPTPTAACLKTQACEFTPPSELRPTLPKSVDAWFNRALNRDIKARFSSAGELLREFRQALQLPGAPVTPSSERPPSLAPTLLPTPTPIEVLWPPRRTARRSMFLAAIAIVGVGLVIGFLNVTSAPWGPAEGKKSQPLVVSAPGVTSSTPAVAPPPEPPAEDEASAKGSSAQPPRGHAASAPLTIPSAPPARPALRAVKAKDALPAPATNSPASPAKARKPIKDRGF